jgi:hypothetical protein
VGEWTSIALDPQGNPFISYSDNTADDLKFAYKVLGVWVTEIVPDPSALVGEYTSLELDSQGQPHISYYDASAGDLKYAAKRAGTWCIETADRSGNDVGQWTSLELDCDENPHISYYDVTLANLKYAVKCDDIWRSESLDVGGNVGQAASLALDDQKNPRISYRILSPESDLKYASAAIEGSPAPGEVWPVGAVRTVTWDGNGRVDFSLSVDGGNSWQLQESGLTGGAYQFTVPHTPSRVCKVQLERAIPPSRAKSDGFFTIEAAVTLFSLAASAAPPGGSGAQVSWRSDPGPEDLAGYRLERSEGNQGWRTVVALTRETSYIDPGGGPGDRYRLSAVNGFGEVLVLGETMLAPTAPLAAWPLPYQGGALRVSFATFGGLGGGNGPADVALYDLGGRRLKTLARGAFPAGTQTATWDGADDHGRAMPNGIYFLRFSSYGHDERLKVVVIR